MDQEEQEHELKRHATYRATYGTCCWRQKFEVSPNEDLRWEVKTSINKCFLVV